MNGPALADRLPPVAGAALLGAGVTLSTAYGSSFLLPETLAAAGFDATGAGRIIGIGTIATIVGSLIAGRLSDRVGRLPLMVAASLSMAAAMAGFALAGGGVLAAGTAGGLLLGLGWSIFYILAPVEIIQRLRPAARLQSLMLLSGAQMLGIGLSAPFGHLLVRSIGSPSAAYGVYGLLSLAGAGLLLLAMMSLNRLRQPPGSAGAMTFAEVVRTLRSRAVVPTVMMAVCGAIFSGLSTFQSLYAASRGLNPDFFFLVFTATTVVLRFTAAPLIGRVSLNRLVMIILFLILVGLGMLTANAGSAVFYVVATLVFASGYGLTYSTLNVMAVEAAVGQGLSAAMASQVFTLAYFVGLFGFPFVAGGVIRAHGIGFALAGMLLLAGGNFAAATIVEFRKARALPWTRLGQEP